jgi:hypothetical protein
MQIRDKWGRFVKGNSGFWLGKKRPRLKDTRAVITMFKKGLKPWNKGTAKTYTINVSNKMYGRTPWNKGLKVPQLGKSGESHLMWKGGKPKCIDCGKQLSKYGTKRCRVCANTGELSPAWRGGVTPEFKKLRQSSEFANWRMSVFERDNYTCQECGERGKNLHPHHIKEFAYYPELRFDINNGQTLCVECHKKTPSYCHQTINLKKGGVAHELQRI